MQTTMTNLLAKVQAAPTLTESGVIYTKGLASILKRSIGDETKLQALYTDLNTNANAWAGALEAGTHGATESAEGAPITSNGANGNGAKSAGPTKAGKGGKLSTATMAAAEGKQSGRQRKAA